MDDMTNGSCRCACEKSQRDVRLFLFNLDVGIGRLASACVRFALDRVARALGL